MLEEQKKKIKEIFSWKKEENNKRKIENLVVFIILLIISVIFINSIWNGDKKENVIENSNTKVLAQAETSVTEKGNESLELEQRLENILQNIEGVGKVNVLLTYSQSSEISAMYNEDSTKSDTEETDSGGGTRKIVQSSNKKEVIYEEVNGEKQPVTQSVIKPKIEGAIVTAVGASNSNIKTNIVQAVEAATGLATHKIQVFEMAN